MEFLTDFQEEKGYSPSIRQIGKSIKVDSTSLIDYYLKQLEEMEYIERDEHISRSIRILKPVYATASMQGGMTLPRVPNPGEMLTLRLAGRIGSQRADANAGFRPGLLRSGKQCGNCSQPAA